MSAERDGVAPYDLVFGAGSIDDRLFPPIQGEAEARGGALDDPDRFLFLAGVGRLLQAIAGPPEAGESEPAERPSEQPGQQRGGQAFRQHGRLLYHAFHYWRAGKVALEMDEARVRRLLDREAPVGPGRLVTPAPAGYIRLPRNLVWAAPAPGLRPEPADGFFWMAAAPMLHLLLVLGVRPDRPGFSVVAATGELPAAGHWADADARPGGRDFATTLPGGELDRLYSLETETELLKLASLCFHDLDAGG
jgi:hypothetical protein